MTLTILKAMLKQAKGIFLFQLEEPCGVAEELAESGLFALCRNLIAKKKKIAAPRETDRCPNVAQASNTFHPVRTPLGKA